MNEKKPQILVIFEGKNPETKIIDSLIKNFNFFGEDEVNIVVYGTVIYDLYIRLGGYGFDANLIDVLIEMKPDEAQRLMEIRRSTGQIYLFFDYDGHTQRRKHCTDEALSEMLEYFNNETENGKLYISYPMSEAAKDFTKNDLCGRRCRVAAKKDIAYKQLVGTDSGFIDAAKLDRAFWLAISKHSIKKAGCMLNSSYEMPAYDVYNDIYDQPSIFNAQRLKYIAPYNEIAILSAFPFFITEYAGLALYEEISGFTGSDTINEITQSPCA